MATALQCGHVHRGRRTAYLFRRALLRDAAYALQMPSDSWRRHALALELIEKVSGGRPKTPPAAVRAQVAACPVRCLRA
jgi:hypothetical protein